MNPFYQSHITGKELTDKGEVIVPSSSVGSNRILCKLAEWSIQPTAPTYDVYMVNLLTFLRNNENADNPLEASDKDVGTFKTYIANYIKTVPHIDPVVIFYLPDYRIPEPYARKPNKRTTKLLDLSIRMGKHVPNDVVDISTEGIRMFFLRCRPAVHPGKQILSYIRKTSNRGTGSRILLWSHVVLDLHMNRLLPNIDLIESYTAKIIGPNQFGRKLVKSDHIPFSSLTHIAFGDSTFIRPVLQRKMRSEALKDAEDYSWKTLTNTKLLDKLKSYKLDSDYLTKLKL